MACGGCGRRRRPGTYKFKCLQCGEEFTLTVTGIVYQKGILWVVKSMTTTVLKHDKCGSTNIKRI
jgi:predicted nucleic acid-binding Zn ribbon protein